MILLIEQNCIFWTKLHIVYVDAYICFRTIFAQRTYHTTPYLRLGLSDPEADHWHDVLQKWMAINNSCCTGLIPLMQRTVLPRNLNWLESFTFTLKGRSRSRDQGNKRLVVPILHWYFRKPSLWICIQSHSFTCCMGIKHFQEPIGVIIQCTVFLEIYSPQYVILYIICRCIYLYRVYVKYAGTSLICI